MESRTISVHDAMASVRAMEASRLLRPPSRRGPATTPAAANKAPTGHPVSTKTPAPATTAVAARAGTRLSTKRPTRPV